MQYTDDITYKAGFESSYVGSQLRQHVVSSNVKSALNIPFRCRCKDIFIPIRTENETGPQ